MCERTFLQIITELQLSYTMGVPECVSLNIATNIMFSRQYKDE